MAGTKYIDKYFKNGRWQYVYKQAKSTLRNYRPYAEKVNVNTASKTGRTTTRTVQKYVGAYNNKGHNVGVEAGRNRKYRYVGVTIGKEKDNYKYKEKSKKIGKVTVEYNNDGGTHHVTAYVRNKDVRDAKNKTKRTVNNAKKRVSSALKKVNKQNMQHYAYKGERVLKKLNPEIARKKRYEKAAPVRRYNQMVKK